MLALLLNTLVLFSLSLTLAFITHNTLSYLIGRRVMAKPLSALTYNAAGLLGTPIHELSHLVAALLFGHHIERVRLWGWGSETAQVQHSYNTRSLWQSGGNFFIAIAPLLTSMAVVWALLLKEKDMAISLVSSPLLMFQHLLLELPQLLWSAVRDSKASEVAVTSLICFYCVPSNTDFQNVTRSCVTGTLLLAVPITAMLLISPDKTAMLLGTVVVASLLTTGISVTGWMFFLLLSVFGKRPC